MGRGPHLMIGALLLFATPLAPQVGLPVSNCGSGRPDAHLLDLTWVELGASGVLATLPGSTVTLLLRSRASGPLDVRVEFVSDGGGADKTVRRARPLVLAAGGETRVLVGLATLRAPAGQMRFSGLVVAAATATLDDRAAQRASVAARGLRRETKEVVYAPDLYFHRTPGGTWLAYGEHVLRQQFRAGDLLGATGE